MNGVVDAVVLAGVPNGTNVIPISDEAPDAGVLTSVACGGPTTTTTTTESTTSTTTVAAGACTSRAGCAPGNPCTESECSGGQCVNRPLGGSTGATCELMQTAEAVCSPKLQRIMTQKLASARAAIARAAAAGTPKKKARAIAAARAAVRAVGRKAAKLAAGGKIPDACGHQIADATQRLLHAIDLI